MGAAEDWNPVIDQLTGDYDCFALNLPGHGSPIADAFDQPLDFDRALAGLIDSLDELTRDPVALIGYSLGGRIALYAALARPDRFRRVVLEGASPGIADPSERRARATLDDRRAETLLRDGIDAFVDRWYEMDLFQSVHAHPETFERMKTARKSQDAAWMAKVIREFSPGRQPPLWDRLGELAMPMMLIAGELDAKYTSMSQRMARRIPSVRVEIVPGAGHNVHLERPERFAHLIQTFI